MIRYVAIDMLPDAATLNGVLRERHSKKEIKVIEPTSLFSSSDPKVDRKRLPLETFVCFEMRAWPYFWTFIFSKVFAKAIVGD